ncbi:hypothetical protein Tco_0750900 [Tanacetum coccineum]|uniref:Uncharacterized protein n=1 Tax=Tanacetum coccineum TaxID=301880 RepID=A0ABQ4Z2J2_9ASTR
MLQMLNHYGKQSNQGLEVMKNPRRCRKIQLEVHGAPILKEDINQKFLRSLPPSWNQIALIMRNKPDIDEIDIDDLYNNLRNTSSTYEVSTASRDFGVSIAGGISQVSSITCAHDVACSFFSQPTTIPQLENEDFHATIVTEKGILLENAALEGIKGKDLMVTMAGAMKQQMNLNHRHWWLKMVQQMKQILKNLRQSMNQLTKIKLSLRIGTQMIEDDKKSKENCSLAAHEKPSESSPKDNDVQDSEDVADKEGQH